jgi:ABC-type multidrug transport system permease subunit
LDFVNTIKSFFAYWLALALLAQVAAAVGYLQSSMYSSMEQATTTANLFTMPFILFGGFFSNPNTYPKVVSWMQYISPIKYAFEMLVHSQTWLIPEPFRDELLD